jgi:hypothetical protein
MNGSSQCGHGSRRSSWRPAAGRWYLPPMGWSVAAALLITCASAQAEPSHSTSYQDGYDFMLESGREAVAGAAADGVPGDSLAVFAGSPQNVAGICEDNLQARIGGFTRKGQWATNFSSQDYLDGCRAAGAYMLRPGAK